MINKFTYALLTLALVFSSEALLAQVDWEKPTAEIEDAQVVIEKDLVITLSGVSRRFEAIPLELPKVTTTQAGYNIKTIDIALPPMNLKLRPQTMKPELLQKFFWGTVKAGYGNYGSPYLSASFATKRNDESSINLLFNQLSSATGPVDGKNSGAGTTDFRAAGKLFMNAATLAGELGYAYSRYHFYGYDRSLVVAREDIAQRLNKYHFAAAILDSEPDPVIDYSLRLSYDFIKDDYASKESDFGLDLTLNSQLSDEFNIRASVVTNFINQSDAEVASVDRRFVKVKPVVGYQWNSFLFEAGLGYFNDNDSLSGAKTNRFYPHLAANYKINTDHTASVSYQGRVERVNLRGLYADNPYLDQHINVNHDVNPVSINFKLQGNITSKVEYQLGYQFDQFTRKGYFVNASVDTTRFTVVYDLGNSTRGQFFAELDYMLSTTLQISGRVNTYGYTTVDVAQPWHKPTYDIAIRSSLYLFDKISTSLNFFVLGGIKSQLPGSGDTFSLDTVLDLNIDLSYAITPRASVFANFMNVLGNEYQLYLNYPVKGFQVIGGFAYNF
jgi:hypothetical protein